jgi:myosin heavy subunit
MNPAMLEASDDLTNLSHLNEPAGTAHPTHVDSKPY